MFVGVVPFHYTMLITECHNSHKYSQSPLTSFKHNKAQETDIYKCTDDLKGETHLVLNNI